MIADYYVSLFNANNETLIESYIIEFIEIFINCLNGYTTFGIKPNITEKLIDVSEFFSDGDRAFRSFFG